jgi:hypothetical protein
MRYQLTAIFTRPWFPNGLSLRLIESRENHAITAQLEPMDFERTPAHVVKGLKREQLIALNSTLLHELCFARMAFGAVGDVPAVGVEEVKAMLDAGQAIRVIDAGPIRLHAPA